MTSYKNSRCFTNEGVTQFAFSMEPKFSQSFSTSQFPLYRIHILILVQTQGIIVRDKILFT